MTAEKPEEAMTFGELLAFISEQQRRITVLESAFSSLAFALDEKTSQLVIHNLKLEAQNQTRDPQEKKHFEHLAAVLEKNAGLSVESPRADDDN
ncbi:hypothetical protein FJU30_08065 [Affinibrenneria salicis]|uniref:Uncharacterized protein n=1 Tax=Affinibrenneria salicis TaxID=2590031 RepID=A0A5J5G404_9GAMM|nr:hypothetical protein [Affinibrenneria salicis]KAA9001401.1 hypothetical protein FJU30_08065 [Affinibrenneria salicis]